MEILAKIMVCLASRSKQLPERNSNLEIQQLVIQFLGYLISQLLHLVLVLTLRRRPWLQFSIAFTFSCYICIFILISHDQATSLMFQRNWYRNFLMKGFHLVVLLAAGPGIRDTQVIYYFIFFFNCTVFLFRNSTKDYCFGYWLNSLQSF